MSQVRSAVPVAERPRDISPLEPFAPYLQRGGPDEELLGLLGSLNGVVQRRLLRPDDLPDRETLHMVVGHLVNGRHEQGVMALRAATDADTDGVIAELDRVLVHVARNHAIHMHRQDQDAFDRAMNGCAAALADHVSELVEAERRRRQDQIKTAEAGPEAVARLAARLLPKVVALEADVEQLAVAVTEHEGGYDGSAIRSEFIGSLDRLRRNLERRVKE